MLPAPMNATFTTARQCSIQGRNEQERAVGAQHLHSPIGIDLPEGIDNGTNWRAMMSETCTDRARLVVSHREEVGNETSLAWRRHGIGTSCVRARRVRIGDPELHCRWPADLAGLHRRRA